MQLGEKQFAKLIKKMNNFQVKVEPSFTYFRHRERQHQVNHAFDPGLGSSLQTKQCEAVPPGGISRWHWATTDSCRHCTGLYVYNMFG